MKTKMIQGMPIRTVCFKVGQAGDLGIVFDRYNEIVTDVAKLVMLLRGESYVVNEGEISKNDVIKQRDNVFKNFDPVKLKFVYDNLVECPVSEDGVKFDRVHVGCNFASAFIDAEWRGGADTFGGKPTKDTTYKAAKKILREMIDAGVLPLSQFANIPKNLFKAAFTSACDYVSSWNACNGRLQEETKDAAEKIINFKETIQFDQELYNKFLEWVGFVQPDWSVFPVQNNFNIVINGKFRKHWHKYYKCLVAGKEIIQTSYDSSSSRKVSYPYSAEGMKLLQNWSVLYANDEKKDYVSDFVQLYIMEQNYKRMKKIVNFKIPEGENDIRYENSGLKFSLQKTENKFAPILVQCEMLNGSDLEFKPFTLMGTKQMEIETLNEAGNCKHKVGFLRGNREKEALVGEVNSFTVKRKNGEFFVYLPIRVEANPVDSVYTKGDVRDKFFYNPLYKAIAYLKTSYGKITDKTVSNFECLQHGFRSMAIDLNTSGNILVCAYYEYNLQQKDAADIVVYDPDGNIAGYANCFHRENHVGILDQSKFDQIKTLTKRIYDLKRFIAEAVKNPDNMDIGWDDFFVDVSIKLSNKNKTGMEHGDKTHVSIKQEFTNIRSELEYFFKEPALENFMWIKCVSAYVKLLKSWSNTVWAHNEILEGRSGVLKFGDKPVYNFSNYEAYQRNLKDYFIKRIASLVRQKAVANKVNVVLMESFDGIKQSVDNQTDLNSLISLWSPRTIIDRIQMSLETSGIVLEEVDSEFSTQIDFVTREFCGRIGKSLNTVRDGKICTIDADDNAARNLQKNLWGKSTEILKFQAMLCGDKWVLLTQNRDGTSKSRLIGALKAQGFGEYCIVEPNGKTAKLSKISKSVFTKLMQNKTNQFCEYFKHEDEFLPAEAHYEKIKNLKGRVIA